jgi:hypothetical protein
MILGKTKRPRNVDSLRAAAILYADWGTSKAYVIGLAFAIAGDSESNPSETVLGRSLWIRARIIGRFTSDYRS